MPEMNEVWLQIEVTCAAETCELLAAEIAEYFNVGVEILDDAVRFYLNPQQHPSDWKTRLEGLLKGMFLSNDSFGDATSFGNYRVRTSEIPDQDWSARWKEYFKPLKVGSRLWIVPSWESFNPPRGALVIEMDPGRAFGTGHHETTRLCLEWLEEHVAPSATSSRQRSLLDVGTGSGILTIAAALLGYDPVLGIDNDPEAVSVARENLARNPAASSVRFQEGTLDSVHESYDVIVANIQAKPLIGMSSALAVRISTGGSLVLSGILEEHLLEVEEAYAGHGLRLVSKRRDGEWCLLVFSPGTNSTGPDRPGTERVEGSNG